ncbi:MAG: 3-oxoacyl-ACP reductase [Acidiferrobacteraceae bacterium]|nr:3-oxoacyl-ACP reductase [Acidiferrobacteraceae bacterium]|tara:strand:- start:351 stop:1142 length:792 start_codon:yes stop_codon:yes gene_type:complete
MDLGLTDKVIMVSGGSRGLGLGIARAAAYEGAKISLSSPTTSRIQNAATNLAKETGVEVMATTVDGRNKDSIIEWLENTHRMFGEIHGLVVNGGGPPAGRFDDFEDVDWQDAFDSTLLSAVRMIRSVLPSMRKQGGGSIITITSSSVKEPIDNLLLSGVMRSGVASLAKSLATELAPQKIRVNNLVPGQIETDRLRENIRTQSKSMNLSFEQLWEQRGDGVPLGRFGEPDEFGKAGVFLLSDVASYVTGETLVVDGGAMKTVW